MPESDLPLVTIVTPSYNQGQYLGQTVESVLRQDYPRLEYIVIDGGSTDESLQILEQFAGTPNLRWLSEPDNGQADAINKGFRLASGDIFGWLNADDVYMPQAIGNVVRSFLQNPNVGFIYGDAVAIDERNVDYGRRLHVHQTDINELVSVRDTIVQPAAFWKAEVWRTIGELDTGLKYALDYEYWMRIARRYRLHYIPILIAQERIYPATKTFSASIDRFDEIEAVALEHGGRGLPHGYHAEAGALFSFLSSQSVVSETDRRGIDPVQKGSAVAPRVFQVSTAFCIACGLRSELHGAPNIVAHPVTQSDTVLKPLYEPCLSCQSGGA